MSRRQQNASRLRKKVWPPGHWSLGDVLPGPLGAGTIESEKFKKCPVDVTKTALDCGTVAVQTRVQGTCYSARFSVR